VEHLNQFLDANGKVISEYADHSKHKNVIVLTANTEATFTVPSDAKHAVLNATANFWIDSKTVTVPSASIIDGTAPMLSPLYYKLNGGETLHFIADSDCTVYIQLFGDN